MPTTKFTWEGNEEGSRTLILNILTHSLGSLLSLLTGIAQMGSLSSCFLMRVLFLYFRVGWWEKNNGKTSQFFFFFFNLAQSQ